jgi:hypothetical protein
MKKKGFGPGYQPVLDAATQHELRQSLRDLEDSADESDDDDPDYFVDTLRDTHEIHPNNTEQLYRKRLLEQKKIDTQKVAILHEALQKGVEILPSENA